jgi:hypothetical protein
MFEVHFSQIPGGGSNKILHNTEGFHFYGRPEKGEAPDAFNPGSEEYLRLLKRLAKELGDALFEMRRQAEPIYMAPPSSFDGRSGLFELYKKVLTECDQFYRVLPETTGHDDEDIESSLLSVHFLDRTYDDAVIRRIMRAQQTGKPCIVCISEELDSGSALADPELIRFKTELEDTAPRSLSMMRVTVTDKPRVWKSIRAMLEKPKEPVDAGSTQDQPVADDERLVYLICDGKNSYVSSLSAIIRERTNLPVYLPPDDPEPEKVHALQERLLRQAAGVMLVWTDADQEWFDANRSQVEYAHIFRPKQRKSFDAQAICLFRPNEERKLEISEKLRDRYLVIKQFPNFNPGGLEPFIERLSEPHKPDDQPPLAQVISASLTPGTLAP